MKRSFENIREFQRLKIKADKRDHLAQLLQYGYDYIEDPASLKFFKDDPENCFAIFYLADEIFDRYLLAFDGFSMSIRNFDARAIDYLYHNINNLLAFKENWWTAELNAITNEIIENNDAKGPIIIKNTSIRQDSFMLEHFPDQISIEDIQNSILYFRKYPYKCAFRFVEMQKTQPITEAVPIKLESRYSARLYSCVTYWLYFYHADTIIEKLKNIYPCIDSINLDIDLFIPYRHLTCEIVENFENVTINWRDWKIKGKTETIVMEQPSREHAVGCAKALSQLKI